MFKPLSVYIGLKYTRAKRRNHFISFISVASILGIALGVAVLITVLSVMNGFDNEIQGRIFASTPHVTVNSFTGEISDWRRLQTRLQSNEHVTGAAPSINTQGLVSHAGMSQGVMLNGILPEQNSAISDVGEHMIAGSLNNLRPDGFGIVIGKSLAERLGAWVGDKIMVLSPKADMTPMGVQPRYKMFKVVGIFNMGGGFDYDSKLVLTHIASAQKLLQMDGSVSQINLKIDKLFQAPSIAKSLEQKLGTPYWTSDWTQQFGAFFQAIQMEKTMMFNILLLLVAIAAFNLVSTLVMLVTDKSSEIAILRTLGATPGTVMGIFMVQGLTIGLFGTLLGIAGGVTLAWNATNVVAKLESLLGMKFISSQVYFIDYLPSQLQWSDVGWVAGAALVLSFLATLYPAWRAARTNPAEALRYE